MRPIRLVVLVLSLLRGQSQSGARFEVASVRAAHPTGFPARRISGGPGTPSPGQITYHEESLKDLLFIAYRVQFYQLATPAWMEAAYFDIAARIPSGANQDDVRIMLQNLLAERFRLKLHHDTKEVSGYELVIAKTGPQLRESVRAPSEQGDEAQHLSSRKMAVDQDGFLILPASAKPNVVALPGKGGVSRVTASRMTMALLCGFLSRQLQRPVVDQTGLVGEYDFHLEFAQENLISLEFPTLPEAGDPGSGIPRASDPAPTLTKAVETQLGLRMEPKKVPVDVLVIDHIDRSPVEN